jgi:ABC-type sugar transport system ATPase subunit
MMIANSLTDFKKIILPVSNILRAMLKEKVMKAILIQQHFVIMKDGTAKDFNTESSLVNTKNNIFEKSFNKSVETYVKA